MASAWLEVNPGDGNPKPIPLPIEWALYPGGWRCKLASLNLGRLPEWNDDEEETAEESVPDEPQVRQRVQSTSRHDYDEVASQPVLAGLIRAERPLPPDWDIPSRPRFRWHEPEDPHDLSQMLREFDLEDNDMADDEQLDRALVQETRNDQGASDNQRRANWLIGQRAVVEKGQLVGEMVRIVGWPGAHDNHVRVLQDGGGVHHSVAMDDLDIVDEDSAKLMEDLRSAARRDPFTIPVTSDPNLSKFARDIGKAIAKDVLPPEEVPEEVQPKEPVTVEPDLPETGPGPLPDQEVDPEHEARELMHGLDPEEEVPEEEPEPDVRVLHDLEIHSIAFTNQPSPFPGAGLTIAEHHPLTKDPNERATLREEADRKLVAPTPDEIAEQAAKGTKKLKTAAAALKRWKRTELPGYVDLVQQGYDPETSVHFRALTPEQREELNRAVR